MPREAARWLKASRVGGARRLFPGVQDRNPGHDKHRDFGAQALLRMMEDRGLAMEAAGAIVIPYINSSLTVRDAMLSAYGRAAYEELRRADGAI